MFRSKLACCVGMLVLTVFSVQGAVIFQDDFSNPGESNTNWNPNDPSIVSKSFTGGELTATNSHGSLGGLLIHYLDNPPSIFTISAKINRTTDKPAGLYFCLATVGVNLVGYVIRFDNVSDIVVWKDSADTQVMMFRGQSGYLFSGYNEIKVSKQGSLFNIFCNGHYLGNFTDNQYPSGNIALMLSPNSTAKFDNVLLTDVFEDAQIPHCFSDDFNDGNLLGWSSSGDAQVQPHNEKLRIKTETNGYVYYGVALELTNFVSRVVVSHRSGHKNKTYGLYLMGAPVNGTSPIKGFVINGNRMYGTFTPGENFNIFSSSKIRGAAFVDGDQTFYYNDTLELTKGTSTGYIFKVNNSPLCTVPDIGFDIRQIGLYVSDSLDLLFDDFIAAEGTDFVCEGLPVISQRKTHKPVLSIAQKQQYVFDPLGRALKANSMANMKRKNLSSGIYLLKGQNRKTVVVTEP